MDKRCISAFAQNRKVAPLVFGCSFLFFAFVMWCAPYSSDDMEFASINYGSIREYLTYVLQYGNGRFLGNVGAILMVHSRVFCILVKAFVMASCVILLPAVLGLSGEAELLLSFLLIVGLDASVFGEVFVWTSGFNNYVPPIWLSMVILCMLRRYPHVKSRVVKILMCAGVFVLGISSQLFMEHSSGVNVLLAFCFAAKALHDGGKKAAVPGVLWLLATVIGLATMLLIPKLFYVADNHSVSYRYTYLGSLKELITSCARNTIHLGSHYFSINALPFCFGATASGYLTRHQRSEKANGVLYGINAVSLLYLLLCLTHSVDGYLGKAAVLQHIISCVFIALTAATWVLAAWKMESKALRNQILFCLAFAVISLLPLLIVSPIPVRVIFQSYIFSAAAALLCFAQIRGTFSENVSRRVKKTFTAVSVLLVLMIGSVFSCVRSMAQVREAHIQQEIANGATQIQIFQLPYEYTTWDHLWSQRMYYSSLAGYEVKFEVIAFDVWMNNYS